MRFLALFALLLFPTILQAQDVTGTWRTHKTERGTLIVNIAPCGASLCGKIVDARALKCFRWRPTARAVGSKDCGKAKDKARNGRDHPSRTHRVIRAKPQRAKACENVT